MNDKMCPKCEHDYVGLECSYCGADAGQRLFAELSSARDRYREAMDALDHGHAACDRAGCAGRPADVPVTIAKRIDQLRRRAEAAEAIVRWFEDDHDEDHCLEKPDDLERLYEELDAAMLGTT